VTHQALIQLQLLRNSPQMTFELPLVTQCRIIV
jgi:hypothetical protein